MSYLVLSAGGLLLPLEVGGTPNTAPSISSTAITVATVGTQYTYTVTASDPGDTLVFSLPTKPTGMTIGSSSGVITWTPSAEGTESVVVRVTDSGGLWDEQSFNVSVSAASVAWFEDSFEGGDPTGWSANFSKSSGIAVTTNEVGGAPGGGSSAFKQAWVDTNSPAALICNFDATPAVPDTIGPGESFYMSWYTYYDPLFDWTGSSGFKQVLVYQKDNVYTGRMYVDITDAGLWVLFQGTSNGVLYANTNGGSYIFPKGEWVKQEWYVYCSTEAEHAGVLKGWINGVLRWDYTNIATMLESYPYWTLNINNTFNNFEALGLYGPNQKRYFDRFVFGPGTMAPT